MKPRYNFPPIPCSAECKPRWVKGKGRFVGWDLKLCSRHQIIFAMRKAAPAQEPSLATEAWINVSKRHALKGVNQ